MGCRPTKCTPEIVAQIIHAMGLGMNDKAVADLIGVEEVTIYRWKKTLKIAAQIKGAVARRKLLRLERVEEGGPGWQSSAWGVGPIGSQTLCAT